MSAYEPDQRVQDFIAALTPDGRRCYGATPGQITHAHLIKALDAGWTPQHIAATCSRDLPTVANDAYKLIQRRIEWFANNKPPTDRQKPASGVPWCGECDDPNWRYVTAPPDDKQLWREEQFRPCPRCHPSKQLGAAS